MKVVAVFVSYVMFVSYVPNLFEVVTRSVILFVCVLVVIFGIIFCCAKL